MFPLAVMFFSRTNRPKTAPTVLDEEYEWVYGRGPRSAERRVRRDLASDRRD